jgi:hypothetical protein
MNGETDARQTADSVPLPPVRTRWTEPDAASSGDESRAPLPPFYASRHDAAEETPVPSEPIDETVSAPDEAEPWASWSAGSNDATPEIDLVLEDDAALEGEMELGDDALHEDDLVLESDDGAGEEGASDWAAFGRTVEDSADWFDASLGMVDEAPPEAAAAPDDSDAMPMPADDATEGFEPGEFEPPAADDPAEDDVGVYEIEVVGLESVEVAESTGGEMEMDGMVPLGVMLQPAAREEEPASELARDLADRLVRLAERLRREGTPALEYTMAEGDRLDASIAGFLAGYVAARGE